MKLYRIEQKEEEIEILYVYLFFKNYQMYMDSENGAVATLLKNDDLHAEGIALDQKFRVVSFFEFYIKWLIIQIISNLKFKLISVVNNGSQYDIIPTLVRCPITNQTIDFCHIVQKEDQMSNNDETINDSNSFFFYLMVKF